MADYLLLSCFVLTLAAVYTGVAFILSFDPWAAAFVAASATVLFVLESLQLQKELVQQQQDLKLMEQRVVSAKANAHTPFLSRITELREEVWSLRESIAERARADAERTRADTERCRRLRGRFCSLCDPLR